MVRVTLHWLGPRHLFEQQSIETVILFLFNPPDLLFSLTGNMGNTFKALFDAARAWRFLVAFSFGKVTRRASHGRYLSGQKEGLVQRSKNTSSLGIGY